MRSARVGTHAKDESSFERRGRVVRHWTGAIEGLEAAQLLFEWQTNEEVWSTETCELKMLTVAENGRLRIHKVSTHDNPADLMTKAMHESRETDQVRTSVELARSILHRVEPTCTVTSVTPITETL